MGIHINELHVWGWEAVDLKKGIHANIRAQNVSIDGCTTVGGANICACVVLNLGTVEARISENWLPTTEDLNDPSESTYFNGKSGVTLLESCFDFRLSLLFGPRNSDEFIDVSCKMMIIFFSISLILLSLEFHHRCGKAFHRVGAKGKVDQFIQVI